MIENKSKKLSDNEISKLKNKINSNENNAGFVFVIFRNKKVAEKLRAHNIFEHASLSSYKMENPNLKSKIPSTENDIIWENMLKPNK